MSNIKPKILYLITQAETGGAQKYIYDLATSQPGQNFEIIVALGQSQDQNLAEKLREKNIAVHQLKHLVRPISPLHDLLAIFEIKKLCRKLKPDIVHLNSTKAGVLGSIASHLIKKQLPHRLIYTAHGWVFNEPMNPLKKKLFLFLEKLTARFKDKIICVSEFDRQAALKNKIGPEKNLITVHNGLNFEEIDFLTKEIARRELNLPADKIILGAIANFYPTKGLKYFIEAVNLLRQKNNNLMAVVIGDGEERQELENLIANYHLQNYFLLLGRQTKAAQYLPAFDFYVCSSVKEGLSYTLLEAALARLPIVATNVGGNPEIVIDQKTGLLAQTKNSQDLAAKIQTLIEQPTLAQELGNNAYLWVKENFSLGAMAEQTFAQYTETIL